MVEIGYLWLSDSQLTYRIASISHFFAISRGMMR